MSSTGLRFARNGASILHNYPNLPSVSPLVFLFFLCVCVCVSPGEVVQRLSVLLATGQFHLSLLIVSMISGTYFDFFSDPFSCFTVSSRDVYHDSFLGSLHSSEFQGLLFPSIPGF